MINYLFIYLIDYLLLKNIKHFQKTIKNKHICTTLICLNEFSFFSNIFFLFTFTITKSFKFTINNLFINCKRFYSFMRIRYKNRKLYTNSRIHFRKIRLVNIKNDICLRSLLISLYKIRRNCIFMHG